MSWIVKNLWLIPALPILAAGISALAKQRQRALSATLAIGSMSVSFLLALCAFAHALLRPIGTGPEVFNFPWMQFGSDWVKLGWILDPLTAVMLVMVTFVGLLIFIYSTGYMAHDKNFTRFFCFLSLFAGAMLGVLISNSLLLLFMCWELVGLTSYLLIGFWYHKPSAAAAAKKAFITTRVGDVVFLLGILWLYTQSGTLLFYDNGAGCMEASALTAMVAHSTIFGLTITNAIGLLIFCGAVGKSGQLPLHVWLPDAMEGPTPVSALIHAATMVAAGVFLIARVYPLMSASGEHSTALTVVTWVGACTALFAASIAVAQDDIKRILAYSTVSQLGYMMLGLGVGGVAIGMFHLITHAFFKALLFMGAGSVIHGCHEEQDIRHMGNIRKYMPATFAAYAMGMLALCGFPLFSGFWSKDGILHAAHGWSVSHLPFYMGMAGALLTAFYMTRQVAEVFFGELRLKAEAHGHEGHGVAEPHESPASMTMPLIILAVFAVGLGFVGTPVWPWFQSFLTGASTRFEFGGLFEAGAGAVMFGSTAIVFLGLTAGWMLYGRQPRETAEAPDPLEAFQPKIFHVLSRKYFIDELYENTFIRLHALSATFCDWLDRWVVNGVVQIISYGVLAISWTSKAFDSGVINTGFDGSCKSIRQGGRLFSLLQNGSIQSYLRIIGVALAVFVLFLIWGGAR